MFGYPDETLSLVFDILLERLRKGAHLALGGGGGGKRTVSHTFFPEHNKRDPRDALGSFPLAGF